MTSTTDEIANLRAALEQIADYCSEASALVAHRDDMRPLREAAVMARRALKTPRASRFTAEQCPCNEIPLGPSADCTIPSRAERHEAEQDPSFNAEDLP